MKSWKFTWALLPLLLVIQPGQAEIRGFGKEKFLPSKREQEIKTEASIARRRVVISQKVVTRQTPLFGSIDDIDFEKARAAKVDEKTNALIQQLETLIKREGQQNRIGELKMRLAELYYARAQFIASQESESWEGEIKQWEALGEAERARVARPQLKTPKADQYRKRTLTLYTELEGMSRGSDRGAGRMIRREEVLFFLASTQTELGHRKAAAPHYEELVKQYPNSERAYAARLNLGDINFDGARFAQAIPYYLEVAAGKGAPRGESTEHIKAYGLYKLGWCYMNLAQYDKAVLALKKTAEMARSSNNDRRIVLEKEALNDLARAFALANQFDEGEKYFAALGEGGEEAFDRFRQEAASIARDNGRLDIAARFYGQLVAKDPSSDQAREFALERVALIGKRGDQKAYTKALEDFAKEYGGGSSWLGKRDGDTRKVLTEELVAMLRREAKNAHRAAQQKDKADLFASTKGFYALYFKLVPNPNPDTPENVHEMKFYYAELLFKTEDYKQAADVYANLGDGKYASNAAYARILSLKLGAQKDKGLSRELVDATEKFVAEFPTDERSSELLYASAQEAFDLGENKEAIVALEKVVERFPNKPTGAEAAERILFILEKQGDIDGAIARSNAFLENKTLTTAGGADFEKRLRELSQRAEFKKAESITGDEGGKAATFLELAKKSKGEIREKALNNALVFAKKSGNADVTRQASKLLVDEYPNSEFSKGIYFEMGESAAQEGRWDDAQKAYGSYLKAFGDKKNAETEAAEWNRLYINGGLDDVWVAELFPDREVPADIRAQATAFLEKYPRSKERPRIVEMLAFRRGSDAAQLAALRKLPGLSSDERTVLTEAEVIQAVRKNDNLEALVKRYPPGKATNPVMRHALALAAFRVIEPKYNKYLAIKINYTPAKFATTLKEKISGLEKLEKDYMAVVGYGNGEWALKSLDRLSALYRSLAGDIDKAPENKEALAEFSRPIHDKGVGFLKTCLDKASELKIGGEGVATCRSAASRIGAAFVTLTDEIVPPPRSLPVIAGGLHPLVRVGLDAAKKNRFGEVSLAQDLVTKDEAKLSDDDRMVLEVLRGLANFANRAYETAAKNFRKASESGNSAIKAAALKNLTALYLEVSDFPQAADAVTGLSGDDADTALLAGLAARGTGKSDEAVSRYNAGLAKSPNQTELLFNKALAQASLKQFDEAAKAMGRFIEMASPAANHISRDLLKRYKGQAAGGTGT